MPTKKYNKLRHCKLLVLVTPMFMNAIDFCDVVVLVVVSVVIAVTVAAVVAVAFATVVAFAVTAVVVAPVVDAVVDAVIVAGNVVKVGKPIFVCDEVKTSPAFQRQVPGIGE